MYRYDLTYKLLRDEIISESLKHPVLDIKDRKGFSGYIDFIKMEEVTSPIMTGYDLYGRKFIVLKLISDGKIILQTLFQRYWNNLYYWRGCGHGTPNELILNPEVEIGLIQLKLILSIMGGKIVKITPDHLYNSQYVYKDVYLFDQKNGMRLRLYKSIGDCVVILLELNCVKQFSSTILKIQIHIHRIWECFGVIFFCIFFRYKKGLIYEEYSKFNLSTILKISHASDFPLTLTV